jgi:diaminopropionate ammonia-lyase
LRRGLRDKNAQVVRSGANYEESIEIAIEDAQNNEAIHLADGSWPGYIDPPRLVMEGYTIMARELCEDFDKLNEWPTHVYLQAGVGGFAAAVAFEIRKSWKVQPKIIVVEPDAAPCLERSVKHGSILTVDGPSLGHG